MVKLSLMLLYFQFAFFKLNHLNGDFCFCLHFVMILLLGQYPPTPRLIRTMRSDTSDGRPVTVKVFVRHGLLRVILVS